MNVSQVYTIVNSVTRQMWGEKAVEVTDLTGLIQLGDTILNSNDPKSKDNFLSTLVDRIGKTIITNRPYDANVLTVLNDSFEFGAIMQKIYVEPIDAQETKQHGLADGTSIDKYLIATPKVKQKLFRDITSWEVQITIPDEQFKTAFTSADGMATFIDAIFQSQRNSMAMQLEAMLEMTYCNFIGNRLVHTVKDGGATVFNLLSIYNTQFSKTLTASQALYDPQFLNYASMMINLTLKRMGRMSVLYNSENYKRHTSLDMARVTMLADFAAATTSFMQANTYHADMVKLPNYNEIPFWQGSGNPIGFPQTSKIHVTTSNGFTVEQDGVVCMITDRDALGITMDNRRSKSAYNERGEYTNFWEKADIGYFNDLSENGVVFVVTDALKTPVSAG